VKRPADTIGGSFCSSLIRSKIARTQTPSGQSRSASTERTVLGLLFGLIVNSRDLTEPSELFRETKKLMHRPHVFSTFNVSDLLPSLMSAQLGTRVAVSPCCTHTSHLCVRLERS
jgi:hypothetical protein